jgi:hypothetical protein
MPPKPRRELADTAEILRDLLIVQLGLAGVPQQKIRAIVGVDIGRVNRIVRHLKPKAGRKES